MFRIEEYYVGPDGQHQALGAYQVPDSEPQKLAALLEVISAQDLRGGGYAQAAVYRDGVPVNVDIDERGSVRVTPYGAKSPHEDDAVSTSAAAPLAGVEHVISIYEDYVYPDGRRESLGVYHVPAGDRRKAADILEVASARLLRAGGYGQVAVFLDDKPVDTYVDAHNELHLTPVGTASDRHVRSSSMDAGASGIAPRRSS